MPVYYLDVMIGDLVVTPGEGIEFSSDELARAYALGMVSTFQSGAPDRVSVRTETGEPIAEVSVGQPAREVTSISDPVDESEPDC